MEPDANVATKELSLWDIQVVDPLLLAERIRTTISLGESHFREFKSALESASVKRPARDIARNIGEELVGFANADGGELLIGVEDDGQITGILHGESTIKQLLEAPRNYVSADTPLKLSHAAALKIDDKTILYFSVTKGDAHIHTTSDGRCLKRNDLQTIPISVDRLIFERREQVSRSYDREFVENANISDIDIDLVKTTFSDKPLFSRMSAEKILQYLDLAEYGIGFLKLRRASLLLFGTDIDKWHSRCQVRLIIVKGTQLKYGQNLNIEHDEYIKDNIINLIIGSWNLIKPALVRNLLGNSAKFEKKLIFPEDACLEALINAISHRDYSIEGQGIEVYLYDDRLEIMSPGEILSTISLDSIVKLKGQHESRNTFIAKTLSSAGYMKELGEGIRRIFNSMRLSDLIAPEIYSEDQRFKIIFKADSIISDADDKYIALYEPLTFSKEEKLIIMLGKSGKPITTQQIEIQLASAKPQIGGIIHQLRQKGILTEASAVDETKIADKPRARKGGAKSFIIRSPSETTRSIKEIYAAITYIGPFDIFTERNHKTALEIISEANIYNSLGYNEFSNLITTMSLLDNRRPTDNLQVLWQTQRGYIEEYRDEFKSRSATILKASNTDIAVNMRIRMVGFGNQSSDDEIREYISNLPLEDYEIRKNKKTKRKHVVATISKYINIDLINNEFKANKFKGREIICEKYLY